MEFPPIEKFAKEVAEKALDDFTYEGKTIREWAEIIVKQQPSEDCTSREEAKQFLYERIDRLNADELYDIFSRIIDDMVNHNLSPVIPKYTDEEINKAQAVEQAYVDKMVELAVEESRQKVKPSDCVNRAVVKLDMLKYGFHAPDMTVTEFADSLPPVTPERPKGKWIGHREHCENLGVMPSGLGAYEWCSNCDCGIDVIEWHRNHYNFCPNCGAEMGGENNGNMD